MGTKFLVNANKLRHRKENPKMKISYHGGIGMELTGNIWVKTSEGRFIIKKNTISKI